jgi:hypothetical protein
MIDASLGRRPRELSYVSRFFRSELFSLQNRRTDVAAGDGLSAGQIDGAKLTLKSKGSRHQVAPRDRLHKKRSSAVTLRSTQFDPETTVANDRSAGGSNDGVLQRNGLLNQLAKVRA